MKKGYFIISSLNELGNQDKKFWANKTPKERMIALEQMRQVAYGYTNSTNRRFQRFFEIVDFKKD